jgi:hypothetical protein
LKQLLEYPGDDAEFVFCRNFVVEYEDPTATGATGAGGDMAGVRSVELMPGVGLYKTTS